MFEDEAADDDEDSVALSAEDGRRRRASCRRDEARTTLPRSRWRDGARGGRLLPRRRSSSDEAREVLEEALERTPITRPCSASCATSRARARTRRAAAATAVAAASFATTTRPSSSRAAALSTRKRPTRTRGQELRARAEAGRRSAPARRVQGPVDVEQTCSQQFKEGVRRQVDKADTATHYDLGIAYMEMGLHAEAIEEFKLCLTSRRAQCTAHTMIGLSYVAKGDMQPGIDHFKHALASPARNARRGARPVVRDRQRLRAARQGERSAGLVREGRGADPTFRDVALRIERLGRDQARRSKKPTSSTRCSTT